MKIKRFQKNSAKTPCSFCAFSVDVTHSNGHFCKEKGKHICEVCGRSEILTPEEAFQAGWDYPPRMGFFGVLSPRTCPDCSLMDTVWAALVLKGMGPDDLTDAQKETLLRIVNEPDSVMPEEEGPQP